MRPESWLGARHAKACPPQAAGSSAHRPRRGRGGGRGCGKDRGIDLLSVIHLHSCFQAEGHLRSSRTLRGDFVRAREQGHLPSAREANSVHVETVPSEKAEKTTARDTLNSAVLGSKKKLNILVSCLS